MYNIYTSNIIYIENCIFKDQQGRVPFKTYKIQNEKNTPRPRVVRSTSEAKNSRKIKKQFQLKEALCLFRINSKI